VVSVTLVASYVVVLTFVAVRARAAREYTEFSLARRSLPLALVFGSLCATYVGPGFSIGFVGKGFESGFLFFGIGLAYSLQNVLVGVLVAPRLRALNNCHTLGDAIGQKYDRRCHVLAGIISVGLCTGYAAVMAKAGGVVFKDVFGLPIWSGVVLIVGITTLLLLAERVKQHFDHIRSKAEHLSAAVEIHRGGTFNRTPRQLKINLRIGCD